jgi:hypothetical protein
MPGVGLCLYSVRIAGNGRVDDLMQLTASLPRPSAVSWAIASAAVLLTAISAARAGANPVKWGAISISQFNGIAAASWNDNSQADAENAANASCDRALPAQASTGSAGGTVHDCEAKVDFYSGYCGAVAQATDGSWSWAWARTRTDAGAAAVRAATGPHATVINSACQN